MTRRIARKVVVSLSLCASVVGCSKGTDETPVASAPAAASGAPSQADPATAGAPRNVVTSVSASGVRTVANVELPNPIIVMKTSLGDIHFRLNQKAAPRTVSNFVDYVVTKHYDGTIFHQIDGGYVALGGTFDEKFREKSVRYPIPSEANNGLKNKKGTIAMAHKASDPNGETSQFFINLADNPKLDWKSDKPEDAGFCVFGEVIEGLDVLEKLTQVPTAKVNGFEKLPVQTIAVQTIKLMR